MIIRDDDFIKPAELEIDDRDKSQKIERLCLSATRGFLLTALEQYPEAGVREKEAINNSDGPYILYGDGAKHFINYYYLGGHPEHAKLLIDCVYGNARKEQLKDLINLLDYQMVISDRLFKNWLFKKALKQGLDRETCRAAYLNIKDLSRSSAQLLDDFYYFYTKCLEVGLNNVDLAPSPDLLYYGSALKGNLDSQKHIAKYLQERSTPFSNCTWTKRAALNGDRESQQFLAHKCLTGKGDPMEAVPWLDLAIASGSTWALYNKGQLLLRQNNYDGMDYMEKAGEANDADAVRYLILWHRNRHHPEQLAYWVEKGKMLGVATAFEE